MQGEQGGRSAHEQYQGSSSSGGVTSGGRSVVGSEAWEEVLDKQSGRSYWWNKVTNRTQWKPPEGVPITARAEIGGGNGMKKELENGWTKQWDSASKKEYFWNQFTEESVWEQPDTRVPIRVPEGWRKEYDPDHKRHYFWHQQTQRSQWTLPSS